MSDFGEVRAWLGDPARTGAALDLILQGWEDGEQLVRELLPYLREQIRRHDIRLPPTDGVHYADWFDLWLSEAYELDELGMFDKAQRGYEDCLRLMPACIPARVHHYRLVHRGKTPGEMLDGASWEAHGPYGDESWEVVERALRQIEHTSADTFQALVASMGHHIEHQSSLYPSTIVVAFMMLCMLDTHGEDARWREPALAWFHSVIGNLFYAFSDEPWTLDRSEWPSCMTLTFSRSSRTEELELWTQQRRQSVWRHVHDFRGYAEYEVCEIPLFPDEVFVRDTGGKAPQNMIYDGLYGVLYQVIAAGLPIYRRMQHVEPGCADRLLSHAGHLARRDM